MPLQLWIEKMTQINIKPSHHLSVMGRTGAGKSVFQHKVLIPALQQQKNSVLVILDGKNEYTDFKTTVNSPQELNEMLYADNKRPKVIRCIVTEPTEEIAEEYLRAAWAPWATTRQPKNRKNFAVRFFIEDMPIYYNSPYATPYWLMKWVSFGRSYHRTVVISTQRAQMVPKTPLQMVEYNFIFKMNSYDRKMVIKQYYGDKANNAVTTLPQYGYVLVSDLHDAPIIFKPYSGGNLPSQDIGIDLNG